MSKDRLKELLDGLNRHAIEAAIADAVQEQLEQQIDSWADFCDVHDALHAGGLEDGISEMLDTAIIAAAGLVEVGA